MKISEYTKDYTGDEPITLRYVVMEVGELMVEIVKLRWSGIKEEFEDVLHFFQLWLYSEFGIDGEIWKITRHSVKKFMDRRSAWNKIYAFAGLPENISGYSGNYKKVEKVVNQLQKLGVEEEKAKQAYQEVVVRQQYV